MILRIWNGGHVKITAEDFTRPLEFIAPSRFIVDFRVTDADPPHLVTTEDVERVWRVSSVDGGPAGPAARLLSQSQLRATLPESLCSENEGGLNETQRRARKKLSIPPLTLRPGYSFTVVVCLREDRDLDDDDPRWSWS